MMPCNETVYVRVKIDPVYSFSGVNIFVSVVLVREFLIKVEK